MNDNVVQLQPEIDPFPVTQTLLGGIGRTTIYELVKRGDLQLVKNGARSFITRESVNQCVAKLKQSA